MRKITNNEQLFIVGGINGGIATAYFDYNGKRRSTPVFYDDVCPDHGKGISIFTTFILSLSASALFTDYFPKNLIPDPVLAFATFFTASFMASAVSEGATYTRSISGLKKQIEEKCNL